MMTFKMKNNTTTYRNIVKGNHVFTKKSLKAVLALPEQMVEIEEHFEDGKLVKRLMNGIEIAHDGGWDTLPDVYILKQVMSEKMAKKLYGRCILSNGTN